MSDDPDNDGLNNLMEYALASNPVIESSSDLPTGKISLIEVDGNTDSYLTISFRRQLTASDLTYTIALSESLEAWSSDTAIRVSSSDNGDGTAIEVWRAPTPLDTDLRQFARLKVSN